jgi:hypothetical protein
MALVVWTLGTVALTLGVVIIADWLTARRTADQGKG